MTNVRAFLVGIIIICVGVYFGDTVPHELRVDASDTVKLNEKECNKNGELEDDIELIAKVPRYEGVFIQ